MNIIILNDRNPLMDLWLSLSCIKGKDILASCWAFQTTYQLECPKYFMGTLICGSTHPNHIDEELHFLQINK